MEGNITQKSVKVFLVEDEDKLRSIIEEYLVMSGYVTECARDADGVLGLLSRS